MNLLDATIFGFTAWRICLGGGLLLLYFVLKFHWARAAAQASVDVEPIAETASPPAKLGRPRAGQAVSLTDTQRIDQLFRRVSLKPGEHADLKDLTVNTPQEVVYYRTRIDGWKRSREKATAWVVKTSDNKAIAFSPQCPHLGCIYHWEDEPAGVKGSEADPQAAFVCPCHHSTFSTEGKVTGGPAPRGLDRYVSHIEGSKLLVGSQLLKG